MHLEDLASGEYQQNTPAVLVVDDDPAIIALIKKITYDTFKQPSFFSAATVDDAYLILNQFHMDFIISDYFLAGKGTGLDLWSLAADKSPWSNFLIISVMSFDQYLDIVSGITYPPSYVGKPFFKKEIRRFFNRCEIASDTVYA